MRLIIFTSVMGAALVSSPDDKRPHFTTTRAKEAWNAYEKAREKAEAELEAKLKKAREDCAKALEAAQKDARKAKNDAEVKAIEEALKGLKGEARPAGKEARAGRDPRGGKSEKGPGGITFTGGNGESIEEAVVVVGAKGEQDGVDSEHFWLRKHYPRATNKEQALFSENGKHYDVLKITLPDGTKKDIYFDITGFFGK